MLLGHVHSPFTLAFPIHLLTYRVGKAKAANTKAPAFSRAILQAPTMLEVVQSIIHKAVKLGSTQEVQAVRVGHGRLVIVENYSLLFIWGLLLRINVRRMGR